ncbi:unnamed protein product, partial [Gulo gulo]
PRQQCECILRQNRARRGTLKAVLHIQRQTGFTINTSPILINLMKGMRCAFHNPFRVKYNDAELRVNANAFSQKE